MITIAGAGLAGLVSAYELVKRGVPVTVYDTASGPGENSVARYAGGMLAPWCEYESAEEEVITLGAEAAAWWAQVTDVSFSGTLVVAPARDRGELNRFARRTSDYRIVEGEEIARLEPALAGRFAEGLYFEREAHLDPRRALLDLTRAIESAGGRFVYGQKAPGPVDLDCTGMAADLPDLRPVRGEMALLHCPEVVLTRTVRLLHPRMPLYVVPRADGIYMIGGTMIESSSARPITLRSLSDLLGAAFTLHPGFAEASVIETGAGLRPAFPDNLPRIIKRRATLYLNGFYRHGFLLTPAMARRVAEEILSQAPIGETA